MKSELHQKLEELALKRSKPFCYGCYREAPNGLCRRCGSDDLMRLVPGVGCEYGTDWVIKHMLENELEKFDLDAAFEESVRQCYPETTKVGWLEVDTVDTMKEADPVSWRCAQSEWESNEADEESIISFDNGCTYYSMRDVENLARSE